MKKSKTKSGEITVEIDGTITFNKKCVRLAKIWAKQRAGYTYGENISRLLLDALACGVFHDTVDLSNLCLYP